MKFRALSLFAIMITQSLSAIPPEFNLRENESPMDLPPQEGPGERSSHRGAFYERQTPQSAQSQYETNFPAPPVMPQESLKVPEQPDSLHLHPTELHITPQRPRHFPERPRKPQGTPPPPLPQYQRERLSSSPH